MDGLELMISEDRMGGKPKRDYKKTDFNVEDKIQQAQEILDSGIIKSIYFHSEFIIKKNQEKLVDMIQPRGEYTMAEKEDVIREGRRFKEFFGNSSIDYIGAKFS